MVLEIDPVPWIQCKTGFRNLPIVLLALCFLVIAEIKVFKMSDLISLGNPFGLRYGPKRAVIYPMNSSDFVFPVNGSLADGQTNKKTGVFQRGTIPPKKTTTTLSQKTRILTNRMNQSSPWKLFTTDFRLKEMYNPVSPYLDTLLHELAVGKIANTSLFRKGTQLKLLIQYSDGNFAIAKPMRVEREFYSAYDSPESFLLDFERHTAEIAAFHLDRLLDFRRVPPCVGRRVNITGEIIEKTNDTTILDTIRYKDGNTCFIGKCRVHFCSEDALTCAKKDQLELSLCQKLPNSTIVKEIRYPWCQIRRRNWDNKNICTDLLKDPEFTKNDLYLDVMEIAVFDYLLLNYDRHHYEILSNENDDGKLVALLDNGKGFGNPLKDDVRLLAPITQCCRFRRTTYQRMKKLTENGNKLGEKLKASLSDDPLHPILTDEFFSALDAKLTRAISEIDKCVEKYGSDEVFSIARLL